MKCETEAPLAKSLFPVTLHRLCLHEIDECCVSAWNKDPVFGVIGIQSGPRG
jgi:hypothetical protein